MKYIVSLLVMCLLISCRDRPTQDEITKKYVYNKSDTIYIKEFPREFIITYKYGGYIKKWEE